MQERTLEELYKKLKEFDRLMDKEEYLLDEIRDAVEAQDLAFAGANLRLCFKRRI